MSIIDSWYSCKGQTAEAKPHDDFVMNAFPKHSNLVTSTSQHYK